METIFKMKTTEETIFISKPNLFTKNKKQEYYQHKKDAYWIEVPIVNKQDEILRTIKDVMENISSDQETKGVIRKTTIDEKMPDVLLLKYDRFNSSGKKIFSQDVKCGWGLTFKNMYYKLKGFIVHEGDSIKKGKYIVIIHDNSTAHPTNYTNYKGYPNMYQAYVLLFERQQQQQQQQYQEQDQEQEQEQDQAQDQEQDQEQEQ